MYSCKKKENLQRWTLLLAGINRVEIQTSVVGHNLLSICLTQVNSCDHIMFMTLLSSILFL